MEDSNKQSVGARYVEKLLRSKKARRKAGIQRKPAGKTWPTSTVGKLMADGFNNSGGRVYDDNDPFPYRPSLEVGEIPKSVENWEDRWDDSYYKWKKEPVKDFLTGVAILAMWLMAIGLWIAMIVAIVNHFTPL